MSDRIQDPVFDTQGRVIPDAIPDCAAVNAGMETWEWGESTDACNLAELKTMMMENRNKPMTRVQIERKMVKRSRVGSADDLLRVLKTLPYNDEWTPDRVCTRKRPYQRFHITPNTVKNELLQGLADAVHRESTELFDARFKTVIDSKTINLNDLEDAHLIHTAVMNGKVRIVKSLLRHGVSVHTANKDQETVLQLIAKCPYDSIRRCLVEYRNNVNLLLTEHVTVPELVRVCMGYLLNL